MMCCEVFILRTVGWAFAFALCMYRGQKQRIGADRRRRYGWTGHFLCTRYQRGCGLNGLGRRKKALPEQGC